MAPAAGVCGERQAGASFGIGIRLADATVQAPALPDWAAPPGTRALGTTSSGRYWLSPDDLAGTSARYRAQLAAQGYVLTAQADDGRSWTGRWRHGAGACFEVRAQVVLGTPAVRVVERGIACDD